jgi:hypothetical protein
MLWDIESQRAGGELAFQINIAMDKLEMQIRRDIAAADLGLPDLGPVS